jgi:hypothetical protein
LAASWLAVTRPPMPEPITITSQVGSLLPGPGLGAVARGEGAGTVGVGRLGRP